nr:phospholipase-like protein [Tanacetum cinerariifolium]
MDASHYDMSLIYYTEGHSLHFGRPEFALITEKHSDEHYFGMKKDPMYVPTYTLSDFIFAFQVWMFESFERCTCWWIKEPIVIPRAVGWSKKSIFNRSDCGYLFAKFKDEFSRLGREFMNSLNILFEELSQPLYTDENLSNDYLIEEKLRLCLEAEERMRLEHEKNIIEEQRFRVKEAKRIKLEEEKLLEISELKKKAARVYEFNSCEKYIGKVNTYKGESHLLCFDHEPQLIDYMLRKQHKVDASHYDMPLMYYTEGHSLHFGRPEFALINGLPFGYVNFGLYTSGELKFRNRVFPHTLGLSVTNLDVIGVIEDEETFQKLCDQDSIRLCLILCLENVIEKHSDEHYFGLKRDRMFGSLSHLKDAIFGGLKIQMLYQEQLVGRKNRSLTDLIVVTFLQRNRPQLVITGLLKLSTSHYDGYIASCRSLYETYLAKWEKSRKHGHSSFITSSGVLTTAISRLKKWIKDEVISQLNLRGFKLETIIQDYLVEEELRLCLEAEERMRLEHEKNIIEEQRFRVNEANRMKLEEEKLLEISELKKRRQEFMNSTHVKSILGKLTHTKGNHVDSMSGKTKATHIDLWIDYMWHGRPDNANWAMNIIQQFHILGLVAPEEGNTSHHSRVLVMLCFFYDLLPST